MNLRAKIRNQGYQLRHIRDVFLPHYEGDHDISGLNPHNIVQSFSTKYGFTYEQHFVQTEDGWSLSLERIYKPGHHDLEGKGQPVILQHGLFQSSGVFVVGNGKDSPAFYLAEKGFDVWLGNNRAVYPKHSTYTPKDQAYWDWSLDDLGKYDFPAIVTYVNKQTSQKVVYVGHSQGNAQAFIGLTTIPELSNILGLFVAMAPAYYVNEFKHWTLHHLQKMSEETFDKYFGKRSFVSIMHDAQAYLPFRLFSSLAYNMYAYVFDWTDGNWRIGQKPVFFQTTPRPISVKLVKHWLHISRSGMLVPHNQRPSDEGISAISASTPEYNLEKLKCPIAVFSGASDYLVDGNRLAKSLYANGANVVYTAEIPNYEHMDLVWGENVNDIVWKHVVELARSHNGRLNHFCSSSDKL